MEQIDLREKILKAASELFEHISYTKTSVADIAQACDIGKGTVYLYFKSKEDIVAAIIQEQIEQLIENFSKNTIDKNITTEELIESYNFMMLDYIIKIRDLLFGSFENLRGNVIRDVFNMVEKCRFQAIEFIITLVKQYIPDLKKDDEALRQATEEYFYVIVGRIILFYLQYDWNDVQPLRKIIKNISYSTFRALVLEG